MKLRLIKVSVPVLMLAIFESGNCFGPEMERKMMEALGLISNSQPTMQPISSENTNVAPQSNAVSREVPSFNASASNSNARSREALFSASTSNPGSSNVSVAGDSLSNREQILVEEIAERNSRQHEKQGSRQTLQGYISGNSSYEYDPAHSNTYGYSHPSDYEVPLFSASTSSPGSREVPLFGASLSQQNAGSREVPLSISSLNNADEDAPEYAQAYASYGYGDRERYMNPNDQWTVGGSQNGSNFGTNEETTGGDMYTGTSSAEGNARSEEVPLSGASSSQQRAWSSETVNDMSNFLRNFESFPDVKRLRK